MSDKRKILKKVILIISIPVILYAMFLIWGFVVVFEAKDKPEMQALVEKTVTLTNENILFRDKGRRLHLTDELETYYVKPHKIEDTLPPLTEIEILKAIYRNSPSGRLYFFKSKIKGTKWEIEVDANKYKPKWHEIGDNLLTYAVIPDSISLKSLGLTQKIILNYVPYAMKDSYRVYLTDNTGNTFTFKFIGLPFNIYGFGVPYDTTISRHPLYLYDSYPEMPIVYETDIAKSLVGVVDFLKSTYVDPISYQDIYDSSAAWYKLDKETGSIPKDHHKIETRKLFSLYKLLLIMQNYNNNALNTNIDKEFIESAQQRYSRDLDKVLNTK